MGGPDTKNNTQTGGGEIKNTNPPSGTGHGQHHGQEHGHGHGQSQGQGPNHGQTHVPSESTSANPQTKFHPIELKLEPDSLGNYFLKPLERQIRGFPSTIPGFSICLGLTPVGQSAIKYVTGDKIDPKMIYVSVFISDKGDVKDELDPKKVGYRAGLILSAGAGVFQLGPVYATLGFERDQKASLFIDVLSPALEGRATIALRERGRNTISLDAKFKGGNGLWAGTVDKSQQLN
ncbi:hypothetical protein BCR34DRAFT_599816 [Clohesyomyces aquaticus]|uniref:Uncharacterized protein n=1 Tax=Clohesyomyces aquaticus TaxID=1231657 RepID=A0A1Y1ZTR7_9PLEO|nr:hypothetical protein BCR34DRAFT_599816 [Clohesyomyces aquaticus]